MTQCRDWCILSVLMVSCPAFASPAEGPRLLLQGGGQQSLQQRSALTSDPSPQTISLRSRQLAAAVDLPIPAKAFGGILIPQFNLQSELRQLQIDNDPQLPNDSIKQQQQLQTLASGLLYLPHVKEGKPHFFAAIKHSADPRSHVHTKPMLELKLGGVWDDQDTLWQLKFSADDETSSRVEIDWRQFPGFARWQLVIGHKIEPKNGLFLDIRAPLFGLIGWGFRTAALRLYGGWRYDNIAYPIDQETSQGWYEGRHKHVLVGCRWRLLGPISIAIESGMHSDERSLYDQTGKIQKTEKSSWGRFARLNLTSWTEYP